LRFLGRDVHIAAERLDTPFTHALAAAGAPLRMPIAHGEGCYYADDSTLDALEGDGQVLFRYVDGAGERAAGSDRAANPNGSLRAIAGVLSARGNVAGLMPHPERASESILGSDDGFPIIRSLVDSAARAAAPDWPLELAGSR
jgi:phosphoribosylformylglycinamidine synthase